MKIIRPVLHKWFIAHPESIGETYWEHWRMALGFSMQLFRAGTACLIHAMVPACFVTNASRAVENLHEKIFAGRRSRQVPPSTAQRTEDHWD